MTIKAAGDTYDMLGANINYMTETESFAHKLGETSERMHGLVANLREKTRHVVEQGRSQKVVSDKAEKAFLQVEDVADRLVHIAAE